MDYVVFLALAPFALAMLVATCVTAWRRRERPEARALFALGVACAGWVLVNSAEVIAPTPGATYRIAQFAYLFSASSSVAWFVFACAFTDHVAWLRKAPALAAAALLATGVALVFTNPLHGLMWRSATYVPVHGLLGIRVVHGPWFYVYAGVSWALLLVGSLLVVREYWSASRQTRRVSSLVAVGALVPLVVSVVYIANVLPVGKDFTPLATAVGAALMAVGLHRYRMLAYRRVARGVLVESMQEGMLALDREGMVMDVNPAFARIVGADDAGAASLVGQAVAEVLPHDALAALGLDGTRTPAEAARTPDAQREVVRLRVGGAERAYDLRASPLADRRGRPAGRLLLLHDITERRAAEDALHGANRELRARNDDLDAFSRTVAHDLKNPIHAIHGYAQILQIDGADVTDDVREECLETILDLSRRMVGIVDALLLLAGVNRESVALVPLDMDEIVPLALARLAVASDRAGAVVEGATPDAVAAWPRALGYAPWVEEVWANYLSNAVKYGGAAPDVRIGAERRGACVRFWVRDRGPGLSAEAQALLFHPFSRLPGSGQDGHGLGLSIVKRIAERLGGDVGVDSTGVAGEGSRFWFDLPAAPDEA